jgi:hypothetical protein
VVSVICGQLQYENIKQKIPRTDNLQVLNCHHSECDAPLCPGHESRAAQTTCLLVTCWSSWWSYWLLYCSACVQITFILPNNGTKAQEQWCCKFVHVTEKPLGVVSHHHQKGEHRIGYFERSHSCTLIPEYYYNYCILLLVVVSFLLCLINTTLLLVCTYRKNSIYGAHCPRYRHPLEVLKHI